MRAVWLRFRAEFRRRALAWLGLALFVGLAGGAVIAASAGARRTESAYPRFLEAQHASDAVVINYPDTGVALLDPARVERLPQVVESVRAYFGWIKDTAAVAGRDNRLGTELDRSKILRGRAANPRRVEEVVLSLTAAEDLRLDIGDSFLLVELKYEPLLAKVGLSNVRLRVVGVQVAPGELPPVIGTNHGFIHLTPAFYRVYAGTDLQEGKDAVIVRLRHGQADLPAFRAALARMSGGKPFNLVASEEQGVNVARSIHLQAVALWLLALLLGISAAIVFAQTIARQELLDAEDHPTLRVLGMTPGQLWALGLARALFIGLAGGVLAVLVAVLLSPLTPIGVARTAEPDPGFAADPAALAVGGFACVLAVLLIAAFPAWRVSRPRRGAPLPRPSRLAGTLARIGLPPPAASGVRMALEPGRGRTAVPVKTTLGAVTIGIAAIVAALTFAASLTHLLETPRLYGQTWDLAVNDYGYAAIATRGKSVLAADPDVQAFSIGGAGAPLLVNGVRLDGAAYDGTVLPTVLAGRAPVRADEIALGTRSLGRLGVGLGDVVTTSVIGSRRRERLRVVGRIVLPGFTDTARLGEGALLAPAAARRLVPGVPPSEALLDLRPGADPRSVLARLQRKLRRGEATVGELPLTKPSDLVNFGRVQSLPLALAGILALLAAATLVHTLVSAVRRRRRELAVMKTLGFVRRQTVAVVLWQATTIAAIAVLIGVPVGMALGRWAWALFAAETGVVREPPTPLLQIPVVAAATLLLANMVAALPGRSAARTKPAEALRAE